MTYRSYMSLYYREIRRRPNFERFSDMHLREKTKLYYEVLRLLDHPLDMIVLIDIIYCL